MDLLVIRRFKIGVVDLRSLAECCIRCSSVHSAGLSSVRSEDPKDALDGLDAVNAGDCEYFESLMKLLGKPYAQKVAASLQVYCVGKWWMILADLKIGLVFEDEYFKAMYNHWGNEEKTICPLRRGTCIGLIVEDGEWARESRSPFAKVEDRIIDFSSPYLNDPSTATSFAMVGNIKFGFQSFEELEKLFSHGKGVGDDMSIACMEKANGEYTIATIARLPTPSDVFHPPKETHAFIVGSKNVRFAFPVDIKNICSSSKWFRAFEDLANKANGDYRHPQVGHLIRTVDMAETWLKLVDVLGKGVNEDAYNAFVDLLCRNVLVGEHVGTRGVQHIVRYDSTEIRFFACIPKGLFNKSIGMTIDDVHRSISSISEAASGIRIPAVQATILREWSDIYKYLDEVNLGSFRKWGEGIVIQVIRNGSVESLGKWKNFEYSLLRSMREKLSGMVSARFRKINEFPLKKGAPASTKEAWLDVSSSAFTLTRHLQSKCNDLCRDPVQRERLLALIADRIIQLAPVAVNSLSNWIGRRLEQIQKNCERGGSSPKAWKSMLVDSFRDGFVDFIEGLDASESASIELGPVLSPARSDSECIRVAMNRLTENGDVLDLIESRIRGAGDIATDILNEIKKRSKGNVKVLMCSGLPGIGKTRINNELELLAPGMIESVSFDRLSLSCMRPDGTYRRHDRWPMFVQMVAGVMTNATASALIASKEDGKSGHAEDKIRIAENCFVDMNASHKAIEKFQGELSRLGIDRDQVMAYHFRETHPDHPLYPLFQLLCLRRVLQRTEIGDDGSTLSQHAGPGAIIKVLKSSVSKTSRFDFSIPLLMEDDPIFTEMMLKQTRRSRATVEELLSYAEAEGNKRGEVDRKIKETKKQVSRLESRIEALEGVLRGDGDALEAEDGSKRKRRKKRSKSGKKDVTKVRAGKVEHVLKELEAVKKNHLAAMSLLRSLTGESVSDVASRSIRFAMLQVNEKSDETCVEEGRCLASEDVSREILLTLKLWNGDAAVSLSSSSFVGFSKVELEFLEKFRGEKVRPHITLAYLRPRVEGAAIAESTPEEKRWSAFKDMDGRMFDVESESIVVATVMHAESVICRVIYIRMIHEGILSEHEAPHISVFGYFVEGVPGFKLPWTAVDPVAARDIEEHLQSIVVSRGGKEMPKTTSMVPDFLGPVWSGDPCEVDSVQIPFRRTIRTKCSIQHLPY
eukprot:TRINITY_DN368_c1_g4_i1.p1 TRINITY_DN368_c1_g4~~TRINITY_DN368_c1_g4_i1.p1  ORF type:complete len:1200 (-),score=327.59 TRINITY_DN368_c1_g4_i1:2152-5751(-)